MAGFNHRVPYSDKVRISQKVRYLSKEKLGELVALIRENCPKAFRDQDKETCQIFVDNIPKHFFIKVANFVDELVHEEDFTTKKLIK